MVENVLILDNRTFIFVHHGCKYSGFAIVSTKGRTRDEEKSPLAEQAASIFRLANKITGVVLSEV